jgi:hypothetical protein
MDGNLHDKNLFVIFIVVRLFLVIVVDLVVNSDNDKFAHSKKLEVIFATNKVLVFMDVKMFASEN